MGLSSTFRWKDLTVSFLLDGRVGGDVYNGTARSLFTNGMHKSLENYRNREVVVKGVVAQPDGTYVQNNKPIILNQTNLNTYFYGVSSNFIEDGSYLRLSYVTVGYDFTRFLKKGNPYIKGLRASITGRNLFLLTKYSGSDPQISLRQPTVQERGYRQYVYPGHPQFQFHYKRNILTSRNHE